MANGKVILFLIILFLSFAFSSGADENSSEIQSSVTANIPDGYSHDDFCSRYGSKEALVNLKNDIIDSEWLNGLVRCLDNESKAKKGFLRYFTVDYEGIGAQFMLYGLEPGISEIQIAVSDSNDPIFKVFYFDNVFDVSGKAHYSLLSWDDGQEHAETIFYSTFSFESPGPEPGTPGGLSGVSPVDGLGAEDRYLLKLGTQGYSKDVLSETVKNRLRSILDRLSLLAGERKAVAAEIRTNISNFLEENRRIAGNSRDEDEAGQEEQGAREISENPLPEAAPRGEEKDIAELADELAAFIQYVESEDFEKLPEEEKNKILEDLELLEKETLKLIAMYELDVKKINGILDRIWKILLDVNDSFVLVNKDDGDLDAIVYLKKKLKEKKPVRRQPQKLDR